MRGAFGYVSLDGATPDPGPLLITPALHPSADWPKVIVIGSLVAMVILWFGVLAVAIVKHKSTTLLTGKAPGPKWSFDSWATTLTAGGAILGTVLATATFPTAPRQIDKESLVRLSLLFGALVIVAPFVFQTIRRPRASAAEQDAGLWGYNWSLLLACSITCGAVLGELAAFGLLSWELIGGHTWGWIAVLVMIVLGVLGAWYFILTSWQLATTDWAATVAADNATASDASKALVFGIAQASRGEDVPDELLQTLTVAAPTAPGRRTWSLP